MYEIAKPLFFRAETPMHVGSGSDLGHIDLPIQREKHTDFPTIQSSTLKGALREHLEQNTKGNTPNEIGVHLTFGYDSDGVTGSVESFFKNRDNQDFSGALAFTDARLLLFPVKSYKGIFALVTCPKVLDKLYQELNFVCSPKVDFSSTNFSDLGDNVAIADDDFLKITDKVILDEYAFGVDTTLSATAKAVAQSLSDLTGQSEILNRLVIVSDDVYRDFTKLSTEVITRTKIQNDTGTVQGGALFTEEYLPAESYMYSLIAARRIFQTKSNRENQSRQAQYPKNGEDKAVHSAEDVIDFFKQHLSDIAQIGGSSTLGKGIVKLFKNQL
jgi:CRISPR-associated protein Cmr4